MDAQTPDDLDLTGLDARAAREYVLAFVKTLKEAERRRARISADLELWKRRAEMPAAGEDLRQAARRRAEGLEADLAEARAEEAHAREQAAILKERLRQKVKGEFVRSVDTEKLEADLEMLVGDQDRTEAELGSARAASDLDDLKKRSGGP